MFAEIPTRFERARIMILKSSPIGLDSVADLLERLGQIPPARVLMNPLPGTATEADVIAAEAAPRKRLCELIDGVLVEKPMGFVESFLAGWILTALNNFLCNHDLGIATGADGMLRLWPGRVRIPDVAFISWDRLPNRQVPTAAIPDISPDLAVEVLSPSNTKKEMEDKRDDYFRAGTREVWEVDPPTRTVTIYTSLTDLRTLSATDTLSGSLPLPGFELRLADLFARLPQQG